MSTVEGRRYGRRTAAERGRDRKERLLAAGLELFGTDGYAATPVTRLCALAGLSTRQLYEEFGSREALLVALYDQVNALAEEAVQTTLARCADRPWPELVHEVLRAYLATTTTDPRWARIAYVEVVGVSAELEEHRRRRRRLWAAWLARQAEEAADRGEIPRQDFFRFMIAFVGAVNGLAHESCSEDAPASPDTMADTLMRLFLGGLQMR
ncbi:MAG TPA: TetR/AcrR family transcriptional regulator [Thermomonospora sp.]|nr:TetR/AcrR family transcriptional regulator [Thermomonospora sp.]